ncbi:unnamed protein product, partial [Vitis vinifera]
MGCRLLWIIVAFTLISMGESKKSTGESCHPDDLMGLISFKAGIRIDTSGRLERWVGRSCCKWEGISYNTSHLSSKSIGKLSKLEEIILNLHHNYLNGHMPAKIGELQVLEQLDLSENLLSGKIPVSLTNITTVQDIDLSNNSLEGEIPFPSCSGQMPFLRFLALHHNHLTGRIPPALGYLVSLQRLYLENNKLNGPIPSSLGNLSDLRELYLSGNRLSGLIPIAFSRLSQLINLNLSNNLIRGLPHEMSSLQNLQTLTLSFNPLNFSSIPKWMAELPSISQIYMAGCGLQGEIPEFLQRKPIQELDLSANHLTGSIPSWLGGLSQLYLLNLSKNALVSEIPDSITRLHELGVLDLHSNKLTGSIIENMPPDRMVNNIQSLTRRSKRLRLQYQPSFPEKIDDWKACNSILFSKTCIFH